MSAIVAHVAGVPVEETLLAFAPALLVGGAVALPAARAALDRWSAPLRRRSRG